ncbi:MBL fold metallo-hydrolase [Leucobacter sp. gxy201]|uniref:MBL fold metallo-hydrolase n=1 Tax=Leucobacter sp. gxy201 TaxID=2957200 RepID=UPI003DA143BC
MEITRFGQSAVLVEDGETRILLDPGTLSGDAVFEIDRLDALLITHEHQDHVDPDRIGALLAANPAAPVHAPAAVLELIGLAGDPRGRIAVAGAPFSIGSIGIEPVGELHQVILPSMPRCTNVGFVLTGADGVRVFHPGDSYETVPAGIDLLALPLLGPWNSLRETVEFASAVAAPRVFPIHDVHLSGTGFALFWSLITQSAAPGVACLDVEQGVSFSTTP